MPSMTESDILLTVAELAVAFGGFATLAGVLGKPRSIDAAYMNASRLRGMLESALLALIFALFPFVPLLFGVDPNASWRIAAAFFLAASIARVVSLFRRFAEIRSAGASKGWLAIVVAAQLASILVLLIVAIGLSGEHAAAAYVLSLFIGLFVSAVFFLRLASTLLASQLPDNKEAD